MQPEIPLSALISQVLVALTIEIDNTYESRAPHRTALLGGDGPTLVSYAMWANFLRLVPPEGINAATLARKAGSARVPHPSQTGMERWRYVTVAPDPDDGRARPPKGEWMVRRTAGGETCAAVWEPLADEVEQLWRQRFGRENIDRVRGDADGLARVAGVTLPGYLPQIGGELFTPAPFGPEVVPGQPSLVTSLANAVHVLALDYERDWPVSLAATANLLRVIPADGLQLREIPGTAGIGKEAARWALNKLAPKYLDVDPPSRGSRPRAARLTEEGARMQMAYFERNHAIEADLEPGLCESLRRELGRILDRPELIQRGLQIPEQGWRAHVRQSDCLPWYPMVLHRGGYPDGS